MLWTAPLREAPDRHQRLDAQSLDTLLAALGDFADLKCPFTLGHAQAVARLAADVASVVDLEVDAVALTRRAGYVHDLGRIGVSNQICSQPRPLTAGEFERVCLHPYLTIRILSQVRGLERAAQVAANHHERVGSSRYPRGLAGQHCACRTACWPRQSAINRPVSHGRTAECCASFALGASNEIAAALVISEKTARNHVERTYARTGVSNRIGASMYAMQHDLSLRPVADRRHGQ
jgi:DNA-binding NarL/FixJ family response regulator